MADVHDRRTRSRNMAAVKGKNTKPELSLRRGLFRRGFRYRLHYSALPGSPDLVLPKYHAAIQINGCFWHGHDCELFQWPASRREFWQQKIRQNQVRDDRVCNDLVKGGWRVLTIWECAIRGRESMPLERVVERAATWITGSRSRGEIRSAPKRRDNR